MKKNVLVYGVISGLIVAALMAINLVICTRTGDFEGSMWIGYASMLISFSMIFVGIKNYRDKYNGGTISFGKAFKVGFFIALIASTIYVIVWLIEERLFFPDFIDKYTAHEIDRLKSSGLTGAELAAKTKTLEQGKELYKNPLLKILMTYVEILPLGVLVSLICALILKRKPNSTLQTQTI